MIRKYGFRLLAAALILNCACMTAAADGEVFSVFQDGEMAPDTLSGILITQVPDSSAGSVQLGDRVLCSGDILTAGQAAQLVFSPKYADDPCTVCMSYLPILPERLGTETQVVFSLRGKENKAPAAEDSALETYRDLSVTGKLKVSDPEGEAMTYAVIRQPRRGTVEILEDGSFTYTPKKNKVGIDSFTYTATDAAGKVSREATVTVTILKPCDAMQYTDTLGRECRFAAEWMKNTGIFTGEQLGGHSCFSPDRTVTRGEFVTMLVKALDIPVDEAVTYTPYGDEVPDWLKPYLAAAIRSGLTADLPHRDTFAQSEQLGGAEAAAMICSALDLDMNEAVSADVQADTANWADRAMVIARSHGFNAENTSLTREQAAMMLYQAASAMEARRDSRF